MAEKRRGGERGLWSLLCLMGTLIPPYPHDYVIIITFKGPTSKYHHYIRCWGFPGGSVVKNPPANARTLRGCGFNSWVKKLLWRRKWQPTPVFFPGKSHGQRGAWLATVEGVARSWTRLSEHAHRHYVLGLQYMNFGEENTDIQSVTVSL